MATQGPIPKRSEQRRRTSNGPVPTAPSRSAEQTTEWPPADPRWTEEIRRWYEAQAESGQASLLEPSDAATLWLWAAFIDEAWQRGEVKASLLSAWSSACRDMLVTEGSRRRVQVEVSTSGEDHEPDQQQADVSSLYQRLKRAG